MPNVPSRTQGWFSRGPAKERRAAATVAGLMRGVLPPSSYGAPELTSWTRMSACGVCACGEQKRVCIRFSGLIYVIGEEDERRCSHLNSCDPRKQCHCFKRIGVMFIFETEALLVSRDAVQ